MLLRLTAVMLVAGALSAIGQAIEIELGGSRGKYYAYCPGGSIIRGSIQDDWPFFAAAKRAELAEFNYNAEQFGRERKSELKKLSAIEKVAYQKLGEESEDLCAKIASLAP